MRHLLLALAVSTPLAASAQAGPAQPGAALAPQKSEAQGVLEVLPGKLAAKFMQKDRPAAAQIGTR